MDRQSHRRHAKALADRYFADQCARLGPIDNGFVIASPSPNPSRPEMIVPDFKIEVEWPAERSAQIWYPLDLRLPDRLDTFRL